MQRWYLSNPEFTELLDRAAEARSRYIRGVLRQGAKGIARSARAAAAVGWRAARGAVRAIVAWQRMRRSVAALDRLDDHMLRDIGIDRSEIQSLARERLAPAPGLADERLPAAPRGSAPTNDNRRRTIAWRKPVHGYGLASAAMKG